MQRQQVFPRQDLARVLYVLHFGRIRYGSGGKDVEGTIDGVKDALGE